MIECETEQALKAYAVEIASGALIIDPLTGKAIPNPAIVVPDPDESSTPETTPSPSATALP